MSQFAMVLILFTFLSCDLCVVQVSSDSEIRNNFYQINISSIEIVPRSVFVPKCCSISESLSFNLGKVSCIRSLQEWTPVLYVEPEKRLTSENDDTKIKFNITGLPNCPYKVLDNRLDKWFNILTDGTGAVGLNFWTIPIWLKPDSKGYCFDSLFGVDKSYDNETSSALVFCELQNFNLYITIRILFGTLFIISAGSVLVTIIIYLLIWDQHSIHGWTQFSFFLSFFLYFISEGSRIFAKYNGLKIQPTTTCFVHALIAHYFTVSIAGTSAMMSLDCLYTFWRLRSVVSRKKKELFVYLFIAWGVPFFGFVAGLGVHFYQNPNKLARETTGLFEYAHYRCSSPIWDTAFKVQIVLLLINFCAFVGTAFLIFNHFQSTAMVNATRNQSDKRWIQFKRTLKLFLKLFFITGVSWTLTAVDLFYGYKDPLGWFLVLIRAYLSLQGFVYLLIFGLHRKNFIKIGKKYPKLQESPLTSWLFKSASNGRNDTNSKSLPSAKFSNLRNRLISSTRISSA